MSAYYRKLSLDELSQTDIATIFAMKELACAMRSEEDLPSSDWVTVERYMNLKLNNNQLYISELVVQKAYNRARLYFGLGLPYDLEPDATKNLSRRVIRGLTPEMVADIFWMRYTNSSWDNIVNEMKNINPEQFQANPRRQAWIAYGIGCARIFLPHVDGQPKEVQNAFTCYRLLQEVQAEKGSVLVSLIETCFGDGRVTRHRIKK